MSIRQKILLTIFLTGLLATVFLMLAIYFLNSRHKSNLEMVFADQTESIYFDHVELKANFLMNQEDMLASSKFRFNEEEIVIIFEQEREPQVIHLASKELLPQILQKANVALHNIVTNNQFDNYIIIQKDKETGGRIQYYCYLKRSPISNNFLLYGNSHYFNEVRKSFISKYLSSSYNQTFVMMILFCMAAFFCMTIIISFQMDKLIVKPLEEVVESCQSFVSTKKMGLLKEPSQSELKAVTHTLNQLFLQRTKIDYDLRQTLNLLATSQRARNMFLSQMSHHLLNPLNSIIGLSEICRMEEDVTPAQKEYLSLIGEHALEMNRMITSLIDLSQAESAGLDQGIDHFDLRNFFHQLTMDFDLQNNSRVEFEGDTDQLDEAVYFPQDTVKAIVNSLVRSIRLYFAKEYLVVRVEVSSDENIMRLSFLDIEAKESVEELCLSDHNWNEADYFSKVILKLGFYVAKIYCTQAGGTLDISEEERTGRKEIVVEIPFASKFAGFPSAPNS